MKATVLASIALGLSTALAAPFTPENAANSGGVSNLMGDVSSINPNFGNHDIKPEESVADGTDSQSKGNKLGSILNEKLASATKREREARDVHNTYLKEDIASGKAADENAAASRVNDENKSDGSVTDRALTRKDQGVDSSVKRDRNVPGIGQSEKA